MSIGLDELGYDERLYLLAFDHRGSFEKMVGDVERVPGAKTLIWEGFQRAVEAGAPKAFAGVLVDGQYGPSVAREAKAGGYLLAMPVEKSGQNEFDFEYGEQFGEKIEEFDPDFSKVLVRYNPEGDQEMNERQTAMSIPFTWNPRLSRVDEQTISRSLLPGARSFKRAMGLEPTTLSLGS